MVDGAIVKPGLTESCADTCCRSTPSALSLTSERAALIRQAFRLEWMTVAGMWLRASWRSALVWQRGV